MSRVLWSYLSQACAAMEAVVIAGLVSNVLQFVDFAQSLVSKTYEIYKSSNGALKECIDIKDVTETTRTLADALTSTDQ